MGTDKDADAPSDRRNWMNLFNACVEMIQTQKIQLDSLVKERKFLEDRIKTQYDHWGSHVRLLEGQISKIKSEIMMEKLERSIDAAASDLTMGSKERESSMYKLKLDHAESEIATAKMLVECLVQKCSDPKDLSGGNSLEKDKNKGGLGVRKSARSTKEEEQRSKKLEIEVRSLKQEYEKLSLQKSAEVSALLLEKNFVLNQYKTMESDCTNKLKSKHVEIERANEKIEKLLADMEQLQSINNEKDVTVVTLETKLAKMEAETNTRNDEISRLLHELELLRKSRSASVTPLLLKCCTVKPTSFGGKNSGSDGSNVFVKKKSSASRVPEQVKDTEKGAGSSRRKRVDVIRIPETPKLFTASFKVPKLKNSSLVR